MKSSQASLPSLQSSSISLRAPATNAPIAASASFSTSAASSGIVEASSFMSRTTRLRIRTPSSGAFFFA